MKGRTRHQITLGAVVGGASTILVLLQQLAATRVSFVGARAQVDVYRDVYFATRDTLDATRDSLRFVRKLERQCRRARKAPRHHAVAVESVELAGPPTPARKGNPLSSCWSGIKWAGSKALWIVGG